MTDAVRFYERWGLNVETYDERTAEEWTLGQDETAFCIEQARQTGGPVLELGCGTGRVTWPVAEAGFEIVGLDLSEPMLQHARAKASHRDEDVRRRLTFVQGSMVDFDLGRTFPLILIPYRSFQSLIRPEDQRACLGCIHRHLDGDGRVVIDLFDPRLEWCLPEFGTMKLRLNEVKHPTTGNTVRVEVVHRKNDPVNQVLTESHRFTEIGRWGKTVRQEERILQLRWTYRHEMRYLLELAGFDVLAEHSDFQGSPPAYGAEQVWIARRR